MTNAELLADIEQARQTLNKACQVFETANNVGSLTEEIEYAMIKAEDHLHELHVELEHLINWEPRPRSWFQ